jgi:hypothetical protein
LRCVHGRLSGGPERSRELYDLCLLECRRVMFDSLPTQAMITHGQLHGTRAFWMMRYAHLLDADEFTKFVTLTPQSESFRRRTDRSKKPLETTGPQPNSHASEYAVGFEWPP